MAGEVRSAGFTRRMASLAVALPLACVLIATIAYPTCASVAVANPIGEIPPQVAKILASDGAVGDHFGLSVAVWGDTMVVGALGANTDQGAAYVFVRSGTTWSQQQKLTASDGVANDYFGGSVAISGDTMVVGAEGANGYQGAAYVFVRSGTTWSQQQKLTASDGASGDHFGHSVAVWGGTMVGGAYGANSSRGVAYVFVRSGTTWSQQQKLAASDGAANDAFGYSVALSSDAAIVGAFGASTNRGAVYVFVRPGATWAQQQKLTASDGASGDYFGYSVVVWGDTMAVGAYGADANQGAAYVFVRPGATWAQQQKLRASDGAASDGFGCSVAVSGRTAVVGAFGASTNRGAAYVFVRSGTTWSQQQKLTASDGASGDYFGYSVAVWGDTVATGAYGANSGRGAAYVFALASHVTPIYVSTVGSDTAGDGTFGNPYATVQKGVNAAAPRETVVVGPGSFTGRVAMAPTVSISGAGATLTILRAPVGPGAVVSATGIGSGATLAGFTITGGSGSGGNYGGGIYCDSSSPTIADNNIVGNTAGFSGGGIYCANGAAPTITGNTISGNTSTIGQGGGIECDHSSPVITGNAIVAGHAGSFGGGIDCFELSSPTIKGNNVTGNSATFAGGICCEGTCSPIIENNAISSNVAPSNGGGLWVAGSSSPSIASNTIADNSSFSGVGGIGCDSSAPAITGNTITGNSGGDAGGIGCGQASPTISNNTITGNTGAHGGGIENIGGGSPAIMGNTLVGNRGTSGGGGIYSTGGTVRIINNVVAGNYGGSAAIGSAIHVGGGTCAVFNDTIVGNAAVAGFGVNCASGNAMIANCIIWDNLPADLGGAAATYSDISDGVAGTGNIKADPHFVARFAGDYRLAADSQCIDIATSTVAPATDRDGIARPWGASFDMGAYEYFVPTFHTTTRLSGPSSVKVNNSLKLNGTVSPSAPSPYTAPGTATITKTRLVGKKWKSAGSAKVTVVGGAFAYSFKPTAKGSWRLVATYSGGTVGPTTYLPSKSVVKGVSVK